VQWQAWRGLDEADPVSLFERARTVCLSDGRRAHTPADAAISAPAELLRHSCLPAGKVCGPFAYTSWAMFVGVLAID